MTAARISASDSVASALCRIEENVTAIPDDVSALAISSPVCLSENSALSAVDMRAHKPARPTSSSFAWISSGLAAPQASAKDPPVTADRIKTALPISEKGLRVVQEREPLLRNRPKPCGDRRHVVGDPQQHREVALLLQDRFEAVQPEPCGHRLMIRRALAAVRSSFAKRLLAALAQEFREREIIVPTLPAVVYALERLACPTGSLGFGQLVATN